MSKPPEFPTYHGPPLPAILNPLSPRHYWLLLKWICFQPSRLKHYLRRADPDLYPLTGITSLRRALYVPAYRRLCGMAVLLTIILSIGIAGLASLIQGTPLGWVGLVTGMIIGAMVGVAFGVPFGVPGGVAFGLAVGVAGGVAWGMEVDVVWGVAGGVVSGVAGGVVGGVAGGVAFGVVGGAAFGLIFGLAWGLVVNVAVDALWGLSLGALIAIGGSRLVLYLLEWLLARRRARSIGTPLDQLERHPALWDELTIWPLPGTARLLRACLQADLEGGLRLAMRVAANPFQRWAAQRALSDLIAARPDPLGGLYDLAQRPALDGYLLTPVNKYQFRDWPAARDVLLGEIGQTFNDATGRHSATSERVVWRLTRRWRRVETTPLARFSAMLHALFRDEAGLESQQAREIKLAARFAPAYEGVRGLQHGDEVAGSFAAMASFLDVSNVETLASAHQDLGWIDALAEPLLRPSVVEALKALGDVSREVAAFQRATSTGRQAASLSRAAGALNELASYVQSQVLSPERTLLVRIVELWSTLVVIEQGVLGEAALRGMTPAARRAERVVERTSSVWQRPSTPFDNPYVVGDPVYPPLLVGRVDVFNRVGEVWSAKANPDSIILYGHRRMGKSSILRNLDQVAPAGSLVVYADMAGETSFVASTADLLLGLADRVHAALRRAYPGVALPAPDPGAYDTAARAQFQFNRLLESVRDILAGGTLILALDEFEAVEKAVEEGKVGAEIYQFVRTKTQEPWLTLVFGGLHTLDEMSRDYQQPFYGSYENIRVSYLSHDAAWRLITNPGEGFELNYAPEAVEHVIAASGGQPYLIQQICRDALDHLNHELFDLEREREVLISLADVQAVLGDDFFRRGTVYFDGVWTQASAPGQRAILRTIAGRDEAWTLAELEAATRLEGELIGRQLRWAERHDILRKAASDPPAWGFYVPLMRQWIRMRG
jgi:hypothetical protein